jgi:hypothetical protein
VSALFAGRRSMPGKPLNFSRAQSRAARPCCPGRGCTEPLDDYRRFRHTDDTARERHRDDHRQQLGREPDSESHDEQKTLQPGLVEQQIDQEHKQHEDLGQADDQHAGPVGALFQGGGRRRSARSSKMMMKLVRSPVSAEITGVVRAE